MSFEHDRREYVRGGLAEDAVAADPVAQFAVWFEEARAAGLTDPDAMVLATADADGRPAARVVLLRGFGPDGFRFFTNYASRKGRELAVNPWAALVFYWPQLDRQVRVEGRVEKLPPEDSDAYFAERPFGSRVAATVSPQSAPIDRDELERRWQQLSGELAGGAVPRPESWGGYRLIADEIELWQGRPNRLHDRLRYRRAGDRWTVERLAP